MGTDVVGAELFSELLGTLVGAVDADSVVESRPLPQGNDDPLPSLVLGSVGMTVVVGADVEPPRSQGRVLASVGFVESVPLPAMSRAAAAIQLATSVVGG